MTNQPQTRRSDVNVGHVTFIGNATTLIRSGGFTILTDPNFLHEGERVHLGYGLNSKRLTNPAMELEALPEIDLVLLSHLHEDHFDRKVEERLDRGTPIVTTPGAAKGLRKRGFTNVRALATWQRVEYERDGRTLAITAAPARHGPPIVAKLMPETMGSIVEFGRDMDVDYRIYITGDTLVFDAISEIPQRYPHIDLAMLHLGGTRAAGITVTMDGEQGVEMLRRIQPVRALPVHFNDYTVFKSPLEDFLAQARSAGFEPRIERLNPGDTYRFEPVARDQQRRAG